MAASIRIPTMLLALAPTAACQAQPATGGRDAPLALERTIPLNGVRGRIDHLAIDLVHRHAFVSELGNGSVEALDLASGASLGRINGLKEPQGLVYLPARDELAVASGGDGSVRFYHAQGLAPAGAVDVGGDADNLRVDTSGRIVVGYGSGTLAVIDPSSRKVIARLELPAHPEGFRLDGGKVFVNLPDAKRIVVGDLAAGRITGTWPTAHLWNFPMAMDAGGRTLAVVYRLPARLQLLDTASGAVKLDRSTCGDADDVFFDETRRRAYVVCGAGAIDVVDLARPEQSRRISTRSGARTGLYTPEFDRLVVAARASGSAPAALLIYRPQP
jgi:DNA-binding beta-propeller fold protein YncE